MLGYFVVIEFVLLFGVVSCIGRFGPVVRLSYDRMVCACDGQKALMHIPIEMVLQRFLLEIFCELDNMNVDSILTLFAVAHVLEMKWAAFENQEWFSYNQRNSTFVILSALTSIKRPNTAGEDVAEGDRAELWLRFHAG